MDIFVLEDIATVQARSGDASGALQTAAKVRALGSRAKTRQEADPAVVACHELVHAEMLAEVALAQAKTGESGVADARKMIEEALRLVDRSLKLRIDVGVTALARIALAQAKLGEVARSRETFQRALMATEHIEGFQRPELMAKIAEAHWKAGETAEARVILRHAFERARPFKDQFPQVDNIIVQVQLEAGDLDGAIETARTSQQERGELVLYPETFRQLVRAQATAIGPRPALAEWWKSVKSPMLRAYAFLGAAEATADPKAAGATVGESACQSRPWSSSHWPNCRHRRTRSRSRSTVPSWTARARPSRLPTSGWPKRATPMKAAGSASSCGGAPTTRPDEGSTPVPDHISADADGRFTFRVPADAVARRSPVPLAVWAAVAGKEVRLGWQRLPRIVLPGDPPIRIVLGEPARTELTVLSPDGKPIAGARVTPIRAGELPIRKRLTYALADHDRRQRESGHRRTGRPRCSGPSRSRPRASANNRWRFSILDSRFQISGNAKTPIGSSTSCWLQSAGSRGDWSRRAMSQSRA